MRKSLLTQELANAFPDWSKVRSDEQSVGQSLLNVIGLNIEPIFTELYKSYKNFYLTTANVGELDLTYRVQLPDSYQFDVDKPNAVQPIQLAPSVSGLKDGTWYAIEEVASGKIKDFWYDAIPSRLTTGEEVSTASGLLLDVSSDQLVVTDPLVIFSPNQLLVSVSGTKFFDADHKDLPRARIRLTGTTWKGTEESEDLIFLFNTVRPSNKTWATITRVDFIDFPESAQVKIWSHPFNMEDYLDPFDDIQQQADARTNLPVFWKLGASESGVNYLELSRYRATTPFDLLNNQVEKVELRRWELLVSGLNITPLDVMPVPFSRKAWVLTTSGLHLFDMDMNIPDLKLLTEKTDAPNSKIEVASDYAVRESDIEINLLIARPIKTIVKYRFSIKYPDGNLLYLVDDDLYDPDSFSDPQDFWTFGVQDDRFLRPSITMGFSDLGNHVLTLEVMYQDETIEVDQRVLLVDSKEALFNAPLSLGSTPVGLAVDHLQKLWILTQDATATEMISHYDIMLVDFNSKQLVFREPYDEVKVVR